MPTMQVGPVFFSRDIQTPLTANQEDSGAEFRRGPPDCCPASYYARLLWSTALRIFRFSTTNRQSWKTLLFIQNLSRFEISTFLLLYSGMIFQPMRPCSLCMNVVWIMRFIQAPASPISMWVTNSSRPSSLG